eukprot:352672-Chlamydomonas_euryale.AAC.3
MYSAGSAQSRFQILLIPTPRPTHLECRKPGSKHRVPLPVGDVLRKRAVVELRHEVLLQALRRGGGGAEQTHARHMAKSRASS